MQPGARAAHVNFGRVGVWLPVQYHGRRVFAAERALRHLGPAAGRPSFVRLTPLLALGLAADGAGQLAGYLAGSGESPTYLTGFEFGRIKFVAPGDDLLWSDLS